VKIERALCDLGETLSLMLSSIFRKLHLGLLQPTSFPLQLANGFETQPLGTLEDLPIKIGDFLALEDFALPI